MPTGANRAPGGTEHMTIRDLVENLPAHIVCGPDGYQDQNYESVLAGDLMSDILVSVEPGALLVTSLATEQAIRSANMVGSPAVLLVNDKLPSPGMRDLAIDLEITLFATPLPMYEACVAIARLGALAD